MRCILPSVSKSTLFETGLRALQLRQAYGSYSWQRHTGPTAEQAYRHYSWDRHTGPTAETGIRALQLRQAYGPYSWDRHMGPRAETGIRALELRQAYWSYRWEKHTGHTAERGIQALQLWEVTENHTGPKAERGIRVLQLCWHQSSNNNNNIVAGTWHERLRSTTAQRILHSFVSCDIYSDVCSVLWPLCVHATFCLIIINYLCVNCGYNSKKCIVTYF